MWMRAEGPGAGEAGDAGDGAGAGGAGDGRGVPAP
jgi:hypothetical protein